LPCCGRRIWYEVPSRSRDTAKSLHGDSRGPFSVFRPIQFSILVAPTRLVTYRSTGRAAAVVLLRVRGSTCGGGSASQHHGPFNSRLSSSGRRLHAASSHGKPRASSAKRPTFESNPPNRPLVSSLHILLPVPILPKRPSSKVVVCALSTV
jgi:hypothetical protein